MKLLPYASIVTRLALADRLMAAMTSRLLPGVDGKATCRSR
jgi:hypothetical protein